jgi:hypothetical protein
MAIYDKIRNATIDIWSSNKYRSKTDPSDPLISHRLIRLLLLAYWDPGWIIWRLNDRWFIEFVMYMTSSIKRNEKFRFNRQINSESRTNKNY